MKPIEVFIDDAKITFQTRLQFMARLCQMEHIFADGEWSDEFVGNIAQKVRFES